MGMNSRNARLVKAVNPPSAIRLVNSKVACKRRMADLEIPTPETYDIIYSARSFSDIPWDNLRGKSIVIKPDHGFGGNGILILRWSKRQKGWLRGGHLYGEPDIMRHIRDILDGQYSKGNVQDRAVIEEMIVGHKFFKELGSVGLADIRVIVYNGVPIMAMLRLPTHMSGGRANLHAGGVGIGVDIGTGITTTAIHNNQLVAVHPETAASLDDRRVPKWRKILEVAVATQRATKLGYTGVDIVLDEHGRVLVLEANARPGLAIQTANLAGLNERVARVRNLKVKSVEHGIRLALELFSPDATQRLLTTRRPILGRSTPVSVTHPTAKKTVADIQAKIDTGADTSSIDLALARKLGYGSLITDLKKHLGFERMSAKEARVRLEKYEQTTYFKQLAQQGVTLNYVDSASGSMVRAFVPIVIQIGPQKIETKASLADRSHLQYPMLLGAKDLTGFYIDVAVNATR